MRLLGEYNDLLWELGYRAEGNFAASAGNELPRTNLKGRPPELLARFWVLMAAREDAQVAMAASARKIDALP